jgi:hypothetical protein
VDVPALNVSPVKVVMFIGVAAEQLMADEPRETDRVAVVDAASPLTDIAKLPVLKAPLVTVKALVLVYALPSVQPPPTPAQKIPIAPKVTLLVVMVLPVVVAKKLIIAPLVVVNATPVAALVQLP